MRRRDFIALVPTAALAAKADTAAGPDQVLAELLAGNERFASGQSINPRRTPADFSKLASGQAPSAV
ncbi:MAG TPA: carbonic anhydrase, partial [Bryobacteraceae bacterium]